MVVTSAAFAVVAKCDVVAVAEGCASVATTLTAPTEVVGVDGAVTALTLKACFEFDSGSTGLDVGCTGSGAGVTGSSGWASTPLVFGVDSSLVVGLMQRLMGRPVKTFSIGFPVKEFDETAYAREVAERLGTEHHEFQVRPDCVEVLEKLAWFYDEPFADSSAIPTYYVSKLTR